MLEDVSQFLTVYGERHPGTVSLANSLGLLVYQLARHYTEHIERQEAAEILENWGPELAERAAWNFTNWVNAVRFGGPLYASDL